MDHFPGQTDRAALRLAGLTSGNYRLATSIVERTLAWLVRYRRLTIRYGRDVAMHRASLHLACALVCWNYGQRL
jgi:hypothetical protein